MELAQHIATVKMGGAPDCANALKSIWDLVPTGSTNLRLVYQHPGLIDAIIKVVGDDVGEGRSMVVWYGCGLLWYLTRCDDNRWEIFQHPGLMDLLLKVAKEDKTDVRVSSLKALTNIALCSHNIIFRGIFFNIRGLLMCY